MSIRAGRRPHHPALPDTWPSAWPSVRRTVLLGSIMPVVAAVVIVVILLLTSSLGTAWWVAVLPLLLLGWPLSLPARVRKVVQDAADAGRLEVVQGTLGALALVPERRLGVRPNAEVVPGDGVRYFLNSRPRGADRA